MKKVILFVLVLCAICSMAVADVDISGMNYDELKALKSKVEEAMYTIDNTEYTMVELSNGKTKPIKTVVVNYVTEILDAAKDYAERFANDSSVLKDRRFVYTIYVDNAVMDNYSDDERMHDLYIDFYLLDVHSKIEDILK